MGAINELYKGRLGPSHMIGRENQEYHRLVGEACRMREGLEKLLPPEQREALKEIYELQAQIASIELEKNYIEGFCDGAALMIDVLTEKHERG